jgi:hypothetical protein
MLLSTLYTISDCTPSLSNRKKGAALPMLLYFILQIFSCTYKELRIFFEKNRLSISERTIGFISRIFRHAELRYEGFGNMELKRLKPRYSDYVYAGLQALSILAAVLLRIFSME